MYDIVCDILFSISTYRIRYRTRYRIRYRIRYIFSSPPLMQDTLCLVAPYPFRLEPLEDFDPLSDFDMTGGDDVWYARPQLFFSCTLCPTGQMGDRGSHREVSLVFFSTFEPIDLGRDSVLQRTHEQCRYKSHDQPINPPDIIGSSSVTGTSEFQKHHPQFDRLLCYRKRYHNYYPHQ